MQEALWYLPTLMDGWWWLLCALFAVPAAMFMFLYMIMNHPFNGLWIARVLICIALACFATAPLNSGFVPWGALFTSIGGLYTVFLIATDWCAREDKLAILRQLIGGKRRDTEGTAHHVSRSRSHSSG